METKEQELVNPEVPEEEAPADKEKLNASVDSTSGDADKDLEQLKKKLADLEETLKSQEGETGAQAAAPASEAEKEEDKRSIFVGNVHFRTKPEDLQEHFKDAGTVNRVTILVDKFTGQPKGFAYVEFDSEAAVTKALALEGSVLHGRPLKVLPKRTNLPRFQLPRGQRPFYPRSRYPVYRPRRRPYYHPYSYQ